MALVDNQAAKSIIVAPLVLGLTHPLAQRETGGILALNNNPLPMNPYPSEVTSVLAGAYSSVDTFIDMGGEAVCDGAFEG